MSQTLKFYEAFYWKFVKIFIKKGTNSTVLQRSSNSIKNILKMFNKEKNIFEKKVWKLSQHTHTHTHTHFHFPRWGLLGKNQYNGSALIYWQGNVLSQNLSGWRIWQTKWWWSYLCTQVQYEGIQLVQREGLLKQICKLWNVPNKLQAYRTF
jgi:hypothetical protein